MAADTKRGRRFCYSCGTVHRPGENTLCPVTQAITSNSAYSGVSPALHTHQCYTLDEAVAQLAAQGLAVVTKAEADELADLRGRVERATAIAKEDRNLPILEALRGR